MKESYINVLLRGSTLVGPSSSQLGWDGLCIERRTATPIARDAENLEQHYAILWQGHPTTTERQYRPGMFRRMIKRPGTVSLGTAGILPAVRHHTDYDVIACVIDPTATQALANEFGMSDAPINCHHSSTDSALASLLGLAAKELQDGGVSGRLYAESLCHALISRFLHVVQQHPTSSRAEHGSLPSRHLKRVLEKIQSEFGRNLSLVELAAETGYSRAQFLRMFREATGKTPHRYLQDVRLDYVRHRLAGKHGLSLAAIAEDAGFANHSHLSRVFKQQFGISPKDYRRTYQ